MNLLIFGANWYNHGDESAIRAMIDELYDKVPNLHIVIQFNQEVRDIPYDEIKIISGFRKAGKKNPITKLLYKLAVISGGRIRLFLGSDKMKEFLDIVNWADYAIYAPGGPCIGEHYKQYYLVDMMEIMEKNNLAYSLFAPSIGPFNEYKSQIKTVLERANIICFREAISQRYYQELGVKHESVVTLDAAFQHAFNEKINEKKLLEDNELNDFLKNHDKIIGITITDLKWHRTYNQTNISERINITFKEFINTLISDGYSIIFIPQLFGCANDSTYMSEFAISNHCFILNENYDCYFQQYLISKLYAVVGMRYHSNIFSAKVSTPFVSIAYEQKMIGFMKKAGLSNLCIWIENLDYQGLYEKFLYLINNYYFIKEQLVKQVDNYRMQSSETMQLIVEDIKRIENK